MSALDLLNPLWDLQITLPKCQVWWDDVQCLCLTKDGSRSKSQSKIKHCMTVFRVRSVNFLNPWWDLQIALHKCQVWWDDVQCLGLTKVGSKSGQNLRFNIVWLYFMSTLYPLNPWLDLQITLHKCQEWLDDVQCLCLTNVCLRSVTI